MLAGDESGYLQVAGSPGALAMLRRQFTNLTRMHATRYDVATGPPAAIGTTGQWKADLAIDVCFVVPNCAAMIGCRSRRPGRTLLTGRN
ncbi:MAG: hypothetical protein HOU81_27480 [Hamadaea sp.]|uniref:hypothetical protein n=1 Tax=Hamadaea sp. TaxID=2024425 RepID=UPI0018252BDB|nr:hypothetical protein [Hamadaea sp.]NUR74569.1 hypothetical protein [Hamadaea sp.]NUT21625.1 hypothetical protein [Hamadaea sp.]